MSPLNLGLLIGLLLAVGAFLIVFVRSDENRRAAIVYRSLADAWEKTATDARADFASLNTEYGQELARTTDLVLQLDLERMRTKALTRERDGAHNVLEFVLNDVDVASVLDMTKLLRDSAPIIRHHFPLRSVQ